MYISRDFVLEFTVFCVRGAAIINSTHRMKIFRFYYVPPTFP